MKPSRLFHVPTIWLVLVGLLWLPNVSSLTSLGSVKNLRPLVANGIASNTFYRAATLDDLSQDDARALMDGTIFRSFDSNNRDEEPTPLSVVMDLRNSDEIEKKKKTRTEGSVDFYRQLQEERSSPSPCQVIHVPILYDVDAFWDEAITRMDPLDRLWATLQTVTSAGALDRAAARRLEQEGLPMLYTVTLNTAQPRLRRALEICAHAAGPVVFHCQKGKDRTGLVAMLLQGCAGASDQEIIVSYAESGPLIGETSPDEPSHKEERAGETFIDWSRFRGSPASAMEQTLKWIRDRHGSVENYLLQEVKLDKDCIAMIREKFRQVRTSRE
eukprot:scaffold11575_cov179-Amphora_coffeaeformis.AAC.1